MESITTQPPFLSHNTTANTSPIDIVATQTAITTDITTTSAKNKALQPDQLALSEEAKTKSAAAEKKDSEDKKSIDASSLSNTKTAEEAAATGESNESDLDKEIRELGMKVLELSVQIQMLQDKEDKESVKERQKLEVDLAMTKGQLDAAIKRKLKQATVS